MLHNHYCNGVMVSMSDYYPGGQGLNPGHGNKKDPHPPMTIYFVKADHYEKN